MSVDLPIFSVDEARELLTRFVTPLAAHQLLSSQAVVSPLDRTALAAALVASLPEGTLVARQSTAAHVLCSVGISRASAQLLLEAQPLSSAADRQKLAAKLPGLIGRGGPLSLTVPGLSTR